MHTDQYITNHPLAHDININQQPNDSGVFELHSNSENLFLEHLESHYFSDAKTNNDFSGDAFGLTDLPSSNEYDYGDTVYNIMNNQSMSLNQSVLEGNIEKHDNFNSSYLNKHLFSSATQFDVNDIKVKDEGENTPNVPPSQLLQSSTSSASIPSSASTLSSLSSLATLPSLPSTISPIHSNAQSLPPPTKKKRNRIPKKVRTHPQLTGSDGSSGEPCSPGTDCDSLGSSLPTVLIRNVSCTVNLCCKFDRNGLRHVANSLRNTQFNPKINPGVVIRRKDWYNTTAVLTCNGLVTCHGSNSCKLSRIACRRYARAIQKLGFSVRFHAFTVVNIMATSSVPFSILLREFSLHPDYADQIEYEPDLSPTLDYRLTNPKVTIRLYANGKMTFLGAKNNKELKTAMQTIFPILCQFRKTKK